jgi:enterochelin esterase-like enzyme
MIRFFYRCLVGLHPPAFRQRFAEEMLCIFDESGGTGTSRLFCDGLISVIRQWVLRSGIWKFGVGLVVSALLILSCGYSLQVALANAFRRGNPGHFAEARLRLFTERNGAYDSRTGHGVAGQVVTAPVPRGWPSRPVEMSPQIAALKERLEFGDRRALEQFWKGATQKGTPLIEPATEDTREVIVTFVWRGNSNTQSVGLLAPLAISPSLPNLPLRRLLDTDLWYGSWQMRDDLRFTYRFVPNLKTGDNPQQFATVDPLNHHKMEVSFEGGRIPKTELSIASMRRAPEERWITKQPNVPAGRVEPHSVKSAILESERSIWVYTPPNYSDQVEGGYRLLVLFDGYSYLNWIPTPTILDNLIHARQISPMVVVLIDNPPESRTSELGYNPAFADFLSKEVLPWVQDHWNVTRDPQKTIVGGYSEGGAAAAFVALLHPDLFGNVLSQSGAFWVS